MHASGRHGRGASVVGLDSGCPSSCIVTGQTYSRAIPALAVTAHAYERDRVRCLEAGFAEHVPKPYELERLLGLIAELAAAKKTEALVG